MDLNDAMYNVRSSSKNSEWEVYIANNATLFLDLMSLGMQHSSLIWLRLNQPFVSLKNFISQLPMKIFCLKINMLDLSWYDEWKTIDYRKGWDLSPLLQTPINIFSHQQTAVWNSPTSQLAAQQYFLCQFNQFKLIRQITSDIMMRSGRQSTTGIAWEKRKFAMMDIDIGGYIVHCRSWHPLLGSPYDIWISF